MAYQSPHEDPCTSLVHELSLRIFVVLALEPLDELLPRALMEHTLLQAVPLKSEMVVRLVPQLFEV